MTALNDLLEGILQISKMIIENYMLVYKLFEFVFESISAI